MSSRSQMTAMNGKRPSSIPARHQQHQHQHQHQQQHQHQHQPQHQQPPTESSSQHFDLIKYIFESWNNVSRELDMCHNQSHGESTNYRNGASVTYYQEREPNPQLKDFEPFNLEAWWGQRVVQSITRNTANS